MSASQLKSDYVSGRRRGMAVLGGAFAVVLLLGLGCNTGPKGPVNVPLEFRPEHSDPLSGSLPSDTKVHLEQVADKRERPDTIGENREDATPVPVYAATRTPAEFIREVVKSELGNFGADVTETPEGADRIISMELRKFFVEETSNYRAEVSCAAEVRDKAGKKLWSGAVAGQGKTFGRSLKAENYQQTLSDATRRMVEQLINNPEFKAALAK